MKLKKGLIAVLITANVIMLVVGILTIPPNLRSADRKEPPAPGTEQTTPVTPSPKEEAPPTPTESGDIPAPEETDTSLSTEEHPDLEDFLWYTEDVLYNDVPVDTNPIDDLSTLTGSWKALIIYDPNDEFDSNAMEFLNINLEGTEEYVSLTLDWYQMYLINEGESIDETSMEDSVFNGKWENGGLWASGPGTIRLTHFYKQNQKQYIVGTIDTPDGMPALIALVRP